MSEIFISEKLKNTSDVIDKLNNNRFIFLTKLNFSFYHLTANYIFQIMNHCILAHEIQLTYVWRLQFVQLKEQDVLQPINTFWATAQFLLLAHRWNGSWIQYQLFIYFIVHNRFLSIIVKSRETIFVYNIIVRQFKLRRLKDLQLFLWRLSLYRIKTFRQCQLKE